MEDSFENSNNVDNNVTENVVNNITNNVYGLDFNENNFNNLFYDTNSITRTLLYDFTQNMFSPNTNQDYNRSYYEGNTSGSQRRGNTLFFELLLSMATDRIVNNIENYLQDYLQEQISELFGESFDSDITTNEFINQTLNRNENYYTKNDTICIDSEKILYKVNPDKPDKKDTCTICFEDMKENDEICNITCKHIFHYNCINEWVSRKAECPNCKSSIKIKNNV